MPESKGRSKPAYTPPRTAQKNTTPNPRWFVPLMLGLMIVGLLWVVTFSVFSSNMFELGENMRFRLETDPLVLAATAALVTRAWVVLRAVRSARRRTGPRPI